MDDVGGAIQFLIALVLSISVHEFGHAWAATRLGDSLPRAQGRLTLSPTRHIDPIGTLLFPLIMYFTHVPLLGWGRPVQTNPLNYTRRWSRSTGSMLVAVAGPAMNLLMALLVSVVVVVGVRTGSMGVTMVETLVRHLIALNLMLLFFNLLPIPPLDGGAVLAWVLPRSMQNVVEFLQRWGFMILLAVMILEPLRRAVMMPWVTVTDAWVTLLVRVAGL